MAQSVWGTTLTPHPGPPNSQSPLEMRTSFRGARPGIRGLMRSSTVTAAMALILVDAVLWAEEKQRQRFRAHRAASAPADACSQRCPAAVSLPTALPIIYRQGLNFSSSRR